MNSAMDYIDINLNIDEKNLYLNQEIMLRIDIKNKSNYTIENGLFRIVLNDSILRILDDKFKSATKGFINISNIEPGFKISLNIPMKVAKIPTGLLENICCYINFHIIKDSQIKDFTYKSNELEVKFISKIEDHSFKVNFSKEKYFIDEDIHLLLCVENSAKYPVKDVVISRYIPSNAIVSTDKITCSIKDRVLLNNGNINIKNLSEGESINLDIPLRIKDDVYLDEIEINPLLSYIDPSLTQIEIQSSKIKATINSGNVFESENFIYEIDKDSGFIDDVINHKLTIKNNTNLELLNLSLENNFSDKVNFVENSLIVGEIYRIGENISQEIRLGDLDKNEAIVVTFKTKVSCNESIEDMRFLLNCKTARKNISQESNVLSFETYYPKFDELSFKKYQSKNVLKLYDVIDVTIEAENTGTCDAVDILIKDHLASGLEFIPSSLYVNDANVDENIINDGIKIKNIEPNEKITINYKAKAVDICTNEQTNAYISYTSLNKLRNLQALSKSVLTTIVGARIGKNNIYMDISNHTAQIGDKITYTIVIENTGNIDCESLKLEVPINDSLEFVNESLRIDDTEYKELNIFDGIMLRRIRPNQIIKLLYQVEIIDFPRPNPISDRAVLNYCFMFENELENNTVYGTKNKLYVNNPILTVLERNGCKKDNEIDSFNKTCFHGDNIYFNLELQNRGNVGIENLCLKLNSLKNLNVDESSIKINNKGYTKIDNKLLHLPNLNVSQKIYLEFYASTIPSKESTVEVPINLEYMFKDLKTQNPYKKVKKIKENIIIVNPDLEVNKFIADKDIEVDREFTKNINIKNTGNILLEDIILDINESEFLKKCKKIIFINGNYSEVNEKIYLKELEVNETVNIAIRYNIESLEEYENLIPQSTVVARYSLSQDKEPILIKKKSNKLNINIKNYSLDVKGLSNNEIIMMNTINKYMFNVVNDGNVDCDFVKMKIELPKEISYVENSLCINGKNTSTRSLSSGIDLGNLECNILKNVSFDFKVNNVPYKNQLKISGSAECEYENEDEKVTKCFKSKETILNVENIAIDIVKVASCEVLQSNDSLQIQTIINNIGSIDIKDMYLNDNQNKNLLFVKDSVYIDGENIKELDPTKGIELPALEVGKNVLLTYDYKYVPTISSNKILHFSNVSYCYKLKNRDEERISTKSNTLYLEGALSTFKEFSIENEYELKDYEPNIEDIINVVTNAKIEQYYEISTMRNTSIENEESTGKKVIIKGIVMDRIEYLTGCDNASLYMLERSQPFSIFINLPNDYDGEEIYFRPKCDNVFYKALGNRGMFISSLISIEGSF